MIERTEEISPATVGLTITEGKALLASLQKQIVTAQVQQHVASIKSCPQCGNAFRTKGHYQSTLRSVYGNVDIRIRRLRECPCSGSQAHNFSTLFTNKSPITPELRYITAKMAALLPFRKVADFLGEFLPLSARASASTVRNRTMKVGRRLQKSAEVLATATSNEPWKELVVGFDGGYVRNRHQRSERNFEVVAGEALDREGHATRFAFVRNGGSEAVSAVGLALRQCGVNEATSVTVLTDGDVGLRAIHQQEGDRTVISLEFDPCSSTFVVFRKPIRANVAGTATTNYPHAERTQFTLSGDWEVNFDPKWGGPKNMIFDRLVDWTQRPGPGIKYYSGTSVYRKIFDFANVPAKDIRLLLDLGELHEVGSVCFNGHDLGIV